jgi:zinc D-Ala-D-Ala carboxypeptidase
MNLSEHFTLEEAIESDIATRFGIDNSPNERQLSNMILAAKYLESVRALLDNKKITVSSWLRVPLVNKKAGGALNSAHLDGFAIDFRCDDFGNPYEICQKISKSEIKFDQIIHEYGRWCHISFDPKMRGDLLTIFNPKKTYISGIFTQKEYNKTV